MLGTEMFVLGERQNEVASGSVSGQASGRENILHHNSLIFVRVCTVTSPQGASRTRYRISPVPYGDTVHV